MASITIICERSGRAKSFDAIVIIAEAAINITASTKIKVKSLVLKFIAKKLYFISYVLKFYNRACNTATSKYINVNNSWLRAVSPI